MKAATRLSQPPRPVVTCDTLRGQRHDGPAVPRLHFLGNLQGLLGAGRLRLYHLLQHHDALLVLPRLHLHLLLLLPPLLKQTHRPLLLVLHWGAGRNPDRGIVVGDVEPQIPTLERETRLGDVVATCRQLRPALPGGERLDAEFLLW